MSVLVPPVAMMNGIQMENQASIIVFVHKIRNISVNLVDLVQSQ
jgi:hypothetical protein